MISETISLLGLRATDKVTGRHGVITSVCFDLYGCVQAVVQPPAKENGEHVEGQWTDVSRLEVNTDRVMAVPDFDARNDVPATYDRGPAAKAIPSR